MKLGETKVVDINQKLGRISALLITISIIVGLIVLLNSKEIGHNTGESKNAQVLNVNENQTEEIRNMSTELPLELKNEVENIRGSNLAVSRWDIDPVNKKFLVYTYVKTDPNLVRNIEGRNANNWTIEVIYDTEFVARMNQVIEESNIIRKNPEMKISAVQWSIDGYKNPPLYEAIVYVSDYTPDNQKLNGTELQGWKISVYRSASYPPKNI